MGRWFWCNYRPSFGISTTANLNNNTVEMENIHTAASHMHQIISLAIHPFSRVVIELLAELCIKNNKMTLHFLINILHKEDPQKQLRVRIGENGSKKVPFEMKMERYGEHETNHWRSAAS